MSKGLLGCGVLVVLALIVGSWMMGAYNGLVSSEEGVNTAWSQVENAYQRRADLIPNLVATVKGASDFEKETLQQVIEARAKATQTKFDKVPTAEQLKAYQEAQTGLSSALSRLMVVVEKYPELKAVAAFRDLQSQLEGTENRIAVERRRFNESAQTFNTQRRTFPTVLIANILGFGEKPYFESSPGSDKPPKVEF